MCDLARSVLVPVACRAVSRSKPPISHNIDYSLSQCGGLPEGESTLQL